MRGSTFLLRPLSFDHRDVEKISIFVSLSISIRFLYFPPPICFPSFFLLFFSPPLSTELPPFCLLTPYFLFLSFFLFSLIFSSLSFSLPFFFIFYFLFLIWIASTEWSKSGGNFPSLSSIATCHHHHFSHAMCHSPRVPCGIHMIMSCVTRHPMPRKA